ncbi:YmfQ family protein [bacterium]|nr:YmfQ family protein [bacterium]
MATDYRPITAWTPRTATDYAGMIRALFPRGRLWDSLLHSTVMTSLIEGLAQEPARFDAAVVNLLNEGLVETSDDTFEDWVEAADLVQLFEETDENFRQRVVLHWRSKYESNVDWLVQYIADLGYTATVEETGPAILTVHFQHVSALDYFEAGESEAGESLRDEAGIPEIEIAVRKVIQAHIEPRFTYLSAE